MLSDVENTVTPSSLESAEKNSAFTFHQSSLEKSNTSKYLLPSKNCE